jgi:hypothetical protein
MSDKRNHMRAYARIQTLRISTDLILSLAWVTELKFKALIGRFKQSSKYRGENATINIREQQFSYISL